MNFLAVDPGLAGTGWALWLNGNKSARPDKTGIIRVVDRLEWEWKMRLIADLVLAIVKSHRVAEIAIEYPAFFQTVKGMMVANQGDLVKLTTLVGYMAGRVHEAARVQLVPVRVWKGQLPKAVVTRRIKKITGVEYKSHAADAVGIGLFVKDRFHL